MLALKVLEEFGADFKSLSALPMSGSERQRAIAVEAGQTFSVALDFAVEIRDVMAALPLLYGLHLIYFGMGGGEEMKKTRLVWRERGQLLGRKGYATCADFEEYMSNEVRAGEERSDELMWSVY